MSFSVEHKIREFVKGLYMKDPVYRGAVCSISGSKMC